MTTEIRAFSITVQPGTSPSAPTEFDISFPPRDVEQVEFIFPPGPMGAVGVSLGSAGQAVIPFNSGAWIIDDNAKISYPVIGAFDSGAWQAFAYNLGNFPHTIQIRFLLSIIDPNAAVQPVTLVSADQLSNSGPGS